MCKEFYAHSIPGEPTGKWQTLEKHLGAVAGLAAGFANAFGAGQWAHLLGRYHDIGKGTLAWQAYLRHANGISDDFAGSYQGRVEHAVQGARYLFNQSHDAGKLLAYCIAGHHGGLPNWEDTSQSALRCRLQKEMFPISIPLSAPQLPTRLPLKSFSSTAFGFQLQFFVRMLYACLVDADFLDTEAVLDKEKNMQRSNAPDLSALHARFWRHFDELRKAAEKSAVTRQREKVLDCCLKAADIRPGLFSLTVPTGGGKTLASLAFALAHACAYGKRRIIYVIPFTGIIEQNAAVFRKMLGNDAVLEHHCHFIPDDADWRTRLAAENWDAPVVVTTNVQFFDSFYARKPSKCRKLHNVADSVVIFDEVQAIPVEKLSPCLEVIRELSDNYGTTCVLCTATQPAIQYSKAFPSGLKGVCEIVTDVPSLFTALKRTEEKYIGILSEKELAHRLARSEQVLCVVNSRQKALDVFEHLPQSRETFHLSALMYPAHRTRIFAEIRGRLEKEQPCRVVSTQLIEAGVDVDFAGVFREVSGIDSIAQAAGRCNRNGRRAHRCPVNVFSFGAEQEDAYFRKAAQSAQKLFSRFDGDLTCPQCVQAYFSDYFWKNQQRMDSDGIIEQCQGAQKGDIQFRDIAAFEMIQTPTVPIIIAIEPEAVEMVERLRFAGHAGMLLRKLQQYCVQIYPYQKDEISDWLENPVPGVHALRSTELYSDQTGLICSPPQGGAFFG